MVHLDTSIASLLPGYDVTRELGRGAMGVVYLGRHRHLERDVAIKELVAALAADPEVRSRFRAEAKILATLSHPHIVPVYDYIEKEGRCLLVMEAVAGGTVWDRFVAHGLTLGEACAMTLATCSAVQHAHDHGVLHRDIKPENLLLGESGLLRVADFGIAKVLNGARTLATVEGSVLGTPAYMSPEQAEGATVGPATDVYAIGTMLYEFISGRLPFDGDSPMTMLVQRIAHRPPPLVDVASAVPPAIAEVVMLAIEPDPNRRYQTPEAFGRELAAAATASLGDGWLARTAVEVNGSPVIRSSLASAPTRAPASGDAAAASTLAPTTAGGIEGPPMAATIAPTSADRSAATVGPAEVRAHTVSGTLVRPRRTEHHDAGFDAAAIRRSDLVPIGRVVRRPGRPWPALAVGLAATGAAVLLAVAAASPVEPPTTPSNGFLVAGQRLDGGAVEVELDQVFDLGGLPTVAETVRTTIQMAGVRVASSTTAAAAGRAEIDLGMSGYLLAGAMTMEIAALGSDGSPIAEESGVVVPMRPWYLSGFGILLVVVALFGAAAAESQFDLLRQGRVRAKTMVNLALAGILLGGGGAVLHGIVVREPVDGGLAAMTTAAASLGLVALGIARAGFARRSRHRRSARQRSERGTGRVGRAPVAR